MKVYVKLLGFLSQQIPDYDPNFGLAVDLPEGSRVQDLLEYLNIDSPGDSVVISDGRVLKDRDRLTESRRISVFPIVHGG